MEKSLHRLSRGDLVVFEGGTKSDGAKFRYEHWAVYIGGGEIIHYQAPRGSNGLTAKLNSGVKKETLQKYMGRQGERMTVRLGKLDSDDSEDFPALDPEEVVERARSKVGMKEYNLIRNNCEHFAKWCKYGKEMSDQIEWGAAIAIGLVGSVAGAYAGITNGMAFAGLLGAMIGGCIGAVGGGGIGLIMTSLLSSFGRTDHLLLLGVLLLLSGDIGVMLNLYTSDMFACIWKGVLLSCTVFCVDYVYDRHRPWVKKTVHVALAVLLIGLFVAGYASTSAAGDFFLGMVGVFDGFSTIATMKYFFRIKHKDLHVHGLLFVVQLVISILYCIGAVVLTGQVTVAGLCLGGWVCGNVYYIYRNISYNLY